MTARVGFIGCGHIARFHARNVRDAISRHAVDANYYGVCDRSQAKAQAFADIAGCPLVTTQADAVIDACDIIYICTETAEHPSLVSRATQAGKHIFCEKPLAKTLAEAQAMTSAVEAANITHQVGLVLHFSPVYRVLEDIMGGAWGPLLSAHMRDDQYFPVAGSYGSNWRADPERAGAGTLLEHSIHDLDLLRRLFGEVQRVHCHTRETSGHPGIEDVAHVQFHHRGGHATSLASIWHNVRSRESSRMLEVFFERARFTTEQDYFGSITMEVEDEPAQVMSQDEVLQRFMQLEGLDPSQEDLRSIGGLCDRRFLQAAIAGETAAPSFSDALIAHEIVDACYRSAAQFNGA